MKKKINMTDEYTTRSGLDAKVLCVDLVGDEYPVAVRIKCPDGDDVIRRYTVGGGTSSTAKKMTST